MRHLLFVVFSGLLLALALQAIAQIPNSWKIHDSRRPERPIITPALPSSPLVAGKAPSDAIVLFDGTDLSQWVDEKGQSSKWIIKDGYMECVKGSGFIYSKAGFGSCQLHLEFATPAKVEGQGQGRGNSGVFLMKKYEVQVLDSYQNKTYSDGQCAAIYGQYPPLVNASLPPGQWQNYDIIFHRPLFDNQGNLIAKATITVFHNQVLVQDHVELMGPTDHKARPPYVSHPNKLPLGLQDHGNPVRFRNIWIRELADQGQIPEDAYTLLPTKVIQLSADRLNAFIGEYEVSPGNAITVVRDGDRLFYSQNRDRKFEILPESETRFNAVLLDVVIEFAADRDGTIKTLAIREGGHGEIKAKRIR